MDAVEFLKQYSRMVAFGVQPFEVPSNLSYEEIVSRVEQWVKEHPVKTRMSEFLKQWPDDEISDDGLPAVAPCQLNIELLQCESQKDCEERGVCGKCRCDFWLKEVE